ncbi:MAG: SGNH/GDSL hydrolase family protein [Mycobacteriaceae bacterium]
MIARPPKLWHRYVAIGDSFTEGMSDAHPQQPNAYVGWADRLAADLATEAARRTDEFGYANLAIRGRLLGDIAGRQTDAAIALQPDLVSIVGGGNDIMRPRANIDALAAELETAVARLRATGADVLMATPPDPKEAPLVRRTRGRIGTYIAHIWSIARRHDAYVLDQWGMAPLRDWRMWSEDRIHMTTEGHRRVALGALTTLGFPAEDTQWSTPLPPAAPISREAAARANARWAKEHVGPWVQRRLRGESSGDHLSAKRPAVGPLED